MFKRLAILLFITLYFTSTSSFALNLHYCGQKLAKIQLNTAEPKSCCTQSAGDTDHCCKNQKLEVEASDQHQAMAPTKIPGIPCLAIFILPTVLQTNWVNTCRLAKSPHFVKPPPLSVPIGLKNCVFRI